MVNSIVNEKNNNFDVLNVSREIGETGVDINSSAEVLFENGFSSKIHSSFKKNLGNQTIIMGKKGKIILQDTWIGKNIVVQLNNKRKRQINFDNKKNIYSYQIEIISSNLINGVTKTEYPGVDIEQTVLNMKIIESWLTK